MYKYTCTPIVIYAHINIDTHEYTHKCTHMWSPILTHTCMNTHMNAHTHTAQQSPLGTVLMVEREVRSTRRQWGGYRTEVQFGQILVCFLEKDITLSEREKDREKRDREERDREGERVLEGSLYPSSQISFSNTFPDLMTAITGCSIKLKFR